MLRATGSLTHHLRRTETPIARRGRPHSTSERTSCDSRRLLSWKVRCSSTGAGAALATAVDPQQQRSATPESSAGGAPTPAAPKLTWMTCRRCKQRFAAEANHREACRYHSEGWTGGELAKAVGFVRLSDAPEHQLAAVMGRTGLLRFWDCCGSEDEAAPGCKVSFHAAFDDEENERRGWR